MSNIPKAPEFVERIEGLEQAVPALDTSLRALIAEEVGDAESAASQQVAGLDATLRALIAEEVAKCLKNSGGLMTGLFNIGTSGNNFTYSDDTNNGYKYILLQAGLWHKGSRIQFMRHDSPKDAGALVLGSGNKTVKINPDGTLLGPDNRELPQYSRWANYAGAWWIGRSNTFTAPGPGWLSISITIGSRDWLTNSKFITVNGVEVMRLFAYSGNWAGTCNNMLLPLNTGDVVAGLVQDTSDITLDSWFIPIK